MKRATLALSFILALLFSGITTQFIDQGKGIDQFNTGPVINSVSPISVARLQTITIRGSGFGDTQPVIRTLSDGSINTVGGGKNMPGAGGTPVIQVNNYARNTWGSGVQDAPWTAGCAIGIFLEKWSDTEIVLGGFGSSLSTTGQGVWNIMSGDPMRVVIITPNGIASYDTTVVSNGTESSPTSSPTPNQTPPIISSVSPISPSRLQTIYITGSGFGIVPPVMIGLSDGTVNTLDGVDTPTIQIRDNALWGGWTAGGQGDAIGIIIDDWTDNQITLGGFGTSLDTHGEIACSIMSGDPIDIAIETSGGMALFSTAVTGSPTRVNQTFHGQSPVITSVSQITASLKQTIHIYGSGFGDVQPKTESLGDGSINTVGGGTTPALRIYDQCGSGSWQAGVRDNPSSGADAIGVILVKWSDTEIVLGGFEAALSTNGQGQWNLSPGDPLLISVLTVNGHAVYATNVVSAASDSIGAPPVISSVSSIAPVLRQNIVISGSGFGDIQPQLMNLSDGSVATLVGGTAPVIRIYDIEGWNSWEAGCEDSQWVPKSLIGVYLKKWSDTEIVLGGFGTSLNINGQGPWNIEAGDPLIVNVQTANGHAAYATTVVSSQAYQNPTSNPKPTLSVYCKSATTYSNFRVEITGSLTYNGTGLQGASVLLSYSVDGGNSWNQLTIVGTNNNGDFSAVWLPSVTGNYLLKAEWAGDAKYSETSTVISLAVSPFGEENLFSVASNSTISEIAFNSSSEELYFTVSGPPETTGYCNVYIPKALISDVSNLKVSLDGKPISYNVEPSGDSWFVSFTYHHSIHKVTMEMNAVPLITVNAGQFEQWIPYGVIIVLIAIIVVLLTSRKTKKL
jgi:hypothetical protein